MTTLQNKNFLILFLASALFVMGASKVWAQPVQGWYVSGQGGASFNQGQTTNPHKTTHFPRGRDGFKPGPAALGSFGYGFGDGFRIEGEGGYRSNGYGSFHDPGFPNKTSGSQQTYSGMVNALFDMDIGQNWIYPYFGAGIGYGRQSMNGSIHGLNSNYKQNITGSYSNFAYQAMFGLSFPIPWVVGLSTTMEYRFFTMLGHHKHSTSASGTTPPNVIGDGGMISGQRETTTDFNHSLFLGLRYQFDPAPPPPNPIPVAVPPAPSPVRTYLIFFKWNSSDLSQRAKEIIAVAARNSTAVQFTKVIVNGHSDTSQNDSSNGESYNHDISYKRAASVKAELIRDGVASGLINIHGYGATHPLIKTGPNVIEPQNRRVEIDLQ